MNPTETEAHEFYSLCRERDCRLTVDEVRHWHDRILSLEQRLEATETLVRQYDGQAEKHLAEIAALAAGESAT